MVGNLELSGAGISQVLSGEVAAQSGADYPVEDWNPPVCNDIGARIRSDGVWEANGTPIGRPALVRLFSRILRRDADGSYWLVTPVEKVPVAVADAPFLAVDMAVIGTGTAQQITVHTNVGDVVAIGADHPLRFVADARGGGLKPYVHVRGRLEALFTRALYYDLVELAAPCAPDRDEAGIWAGGIWFELREG